MPATKHSARTVKPKKTSTAAKREPDLAKPGQFVVRKSVRLNAEPAVVWDALTNPDKTKQYFFNCEVHSDWKAGSPIVWKGRIFLIKKIELKGTIVRIQPERMLRYTLKNEQDKANPKSFSTVTEELSFQNGVTTLSISDDVGAGPGAKERYERSVRGWDSVLKGLKKLVEQK
ncbi:MAG TPA: SRPBCC domain-containing protein [Cyclobacteriaceae bacterium]|nr:SRPBCC domain-containing protein [Cyclobacteriaceae bacterium]